jgi:hypothetical protein
MNEVKIEILQLKCLQGSLDSRTDILRTVVSVPELASDKDFVTWDLCFGESLTNFVFVLICGSSIIGCQICLQMRK